MLAGVDREHLSGHVACFGKIENRVGDIVRRDRAGERQAPHLQRETRFALAVVRRDRARPDCVYAYALRREGLRHRQVAAQSADLLKL